MAEFKIKIAGAVAAVTSLFDSTPHYLGAYLAEDAPHFSVAVTRADIRFEQAELDKEALEEGFRRRVFTDPFLERAAIQRAFAEFLFDRDVLLLHGSAVAVDGKAYLFLAKSGTGKSTHTRYWREFFGQRAVMINDDKPFLRISQNGVTAFGSPWSGKHGLDTNTSAPLAGICILERGIENQIWPLSPEDVLPMALKQGYCPMAAEKRPQVEALIQQLTKTVPLWRMTCTKDPQAAPVAYRAMCREE